MNSMEIPRDPALDPEPDFGPSDSSDSASDMPRSWRGTDSDAAGTGERGSVDGGPVQPEAPDIAPDEVVDEEDIGMGHSRKDYDGGPEPTPDDEVAS